LEVSVSYGKSQLPLNDLAQLNNNELAQIRIEEINLACAAGLRGSEDLDRDACLTKLDEWVDEVRHETQRNWYRFLEHPADYECSAAYFRILVMITVLQRDLGCMYNPSRISDETFQDPFAVNPDFSDSRDLFIHGILFGNGGTCASMPVLYVAVGRALGYPLALVESKGHLFCRWDDCTGVYAPPERFNIEGSGKGFGSYPDEHYTEWPVKLSELELNSGWYFKSLSPRQELAAFLSTRGACLTDTCRFAEALECFDWCRRLTREYRYEELLLREQERFNRIIAARRASLLELHQYTRSRNAHRQHGQQPPVVPPGVVVKLARGTPWPAGLPRNTPVQCVSPSWLIPIHSRTCNSNQLRLTKLLKNVRQNCALKTTGCSTSNPRFIKHCRTMRLLTSPTNKGTEHVHSTHRSLAVSGSGGLFDGT
jgi:hypothetical protein